MFRCAALVRLHILQEKEIKAESRNVNGSQSKGGRGGNEGRKGHVEVMLAAEIITTLKLVTYRKGIIFSFPR